MIETHILLVKSISPSDQLTLWEITMFNMHDVQYVTVNYRMGPPRDVDVGL